MVWKQNKTFIEHNTWSLNISPFVQINKNYENKIAIIFLSFSIQ